MSIYIYIYSSISDIVISTKSIPLIESKKSRLAMQHYFFNWKFKYLINTLWLHLLEKEKYITNFLCTLMQGLETLKFM